MHGAHLVKELKCLSPELTITGIGSKQMKSAGVEIFADLAQYAVIGFWEILKHLKTYKSVFNLTLQKIKELNPQAIVLIDYPGFNLRLAKKVKEDFPHIKIIYYISPQIWAWGGKRVSLIKKIVDKMIVLFDFEKELYERNNVPVAFVGHPLMDTLSKTCEQPELLKKLNIQFRENIIALLPGSRETEVRRILPVMLEGAKLLAKKIPQTTFLLIKSGNIKSALINHYLKDYKDLNLTVISEKTYEHLKLCSFAWVCSGTATLETAILGVPMLIVYKTSFFTWFISKTLIKLPFIGLINVVAGKKIIPEFIQFQATAKNISQCSYEFFLKNKESQNRIKQELVLAKQKLGSIGANKKAAQVIIDVLLMEPNLRPKHRR